MRTICPWLAAGVLATIFLGCGESGSLTAGVAELSTAPPGVVPDQLVIQTVPGTSPAEVTALARQVGATVADRLDSLSAVLLQVDPVRRDSAAQQLGSSPLVEDVLANNTYGASPVASSEAAARQWHLDEIRAPATWMRGTGRGVTVAVLDTGVDAGHPDLAGRVRGGANTADGVSGWGDGFGHGTAVAGAIAARANAVRQTSSVAPDASILSVRVTDAQNRATSWSLAAGIAYAVDAGARVINISLAPDGAESDTLLTRQCEWARVRGVLAVMSMGNTGARSGAEPTESLLLVGATTQARTRAGFSTFGDAVALAAPGERILTTARGGGYAAYDGTSLAAPIVSGVAALALSARADLRPSTLRGILLSTALDLGPAGPDVEFGAGLVDAAAAVELAAATAAYADTTPPALTVRGLSDGQTLSTAATVEAIVSDAADIADVTLAVDGQLIAVDSLAPFAIRLDPSAFRAGDHQVTVTATDVFGNASTRTLRITFRPDVDTTPPRLTFSAPAAGSTVRGVVTLRVDCTDNRGLASAEFSAAGQSLGTVPLAGTDAPAVVNWDVAASRVPTGETTLTVRVYDAAGNSETASIRVTVAR